MQNAVLSAPQKRDQPRYSPYLGDLAGEIGANIFAAGELGRLLK